MCQKQPCLFIAQSGETLPGEYRRSTARTAGECQMLLLLLLLMVWAPLPIHPQILVEDDRCNQTNWQRNPEGVPDKKSHLLNVSVSNQGRSNSLFLTWEKLPRGVQNVSLALYKFDTNTVLQNGSAGLNATGFLFEGLLPGTQYDIEVTVLLICTQNSSRRVTGRTVPGPVRNVVLSHNSPSMLLASWSEATGGKDAYQLVLYHIKSQAPVKNVTIPRNATTYRFEKLLNGSEYALQITTLAGSYKASTIARHWTAPVVPETLAFQNSGSSSNLSASWSNAGGAEWFHFTLQNLHTVTEITTVSLKRGLTNYTFQHLKPGTPYRLEVSATAGPYRVEGPKVTAYTYPLKPTNLSLNSYGKSNTLKASWNSSAGEREFYLVLLQEGESNVPIRNMSVGGNTTQLTLDNLSPGSLYTLWVTAVAGPYKASAKSISAWTYPLPLKHLKLSNKGKNTKSLQASWQIPPGEKGRYIGTVMETKSQLEVTNVTVEMSNQRTNITFEGLLPGRQYTLKMVGVAGPHQSLVQRVTNWTYPLAPSGITLVSSRWPSSLLASWEIPQGDRDQFFLRFYSQERPLLQRNVTIGPDKQNFTFEGLLPGTQYFLEVSALAGPYRASSQVVSAWTYPLSLSNVSVKCGQSPQQLIVSWMESGRGREYWVQLYSEESLSFIQNVSVPHGTTQVTLNNLVPGTRYRVEIVSRAGPHYISSQTAIGYTVPLMPLSLMVTSPISSVLSVQWKAPAGQRDKYMVSVSEEGATDTKWHMAIEKANTNTTITGLAPGTCYFIAVWSLAGPYSSASRNDTACTPPAPPVNLTLKNLANASVLYTAWAKPPGGRDHYRMILYSLLPPGMERVRDVGPDTQDFLWTGLPAGSQFAVQVTAVKGQAEASSTIAVAWTSPLPVTFVKTWNEKRPGRLSVSWVPTSGRLDSYELNLYPSEPIATALHTSLGKDATNFTFSGLLPGTKYLYEIISRAGPTRSSSGNFSAWTSPLPPRIVHLSNKGYTDRLNAFWEPTAGGHDGYILTLYYAGSGTVAAKASVEKGVTNFTFTGLIPGSEYLLEVASTAGPHRIPARNVSDWTYPLVPRKLAIKSDKRNPALLVTWAKPLSKPERCQLQLWLSGNKTVLQRHTLVKWEIQHVFQGLVPGRNYSVSLSCTAGPYENSSEMMAMPIEPSQVKELQCLPDATSMFLNWTISEGDIEAYELTVRKFSRGGLQKSKRLLAVSRADTILTELTSNTAYQISVSAVGKNGMKSPMVALGCNTSVEVLPPPVQVDIPQFDDSSRVIISPDMFSEDNGLIEYYGVVVTTNESLLRPTQDIISRTWYDHYYGHEDSYLALLLPNPFHLNESTSPKSWPVTVGAEECSQSRETCNGKLKTDAQYRFSIAAFTRYSQRTPRVSFTSFSAADASTASAASVNISAPLVSGIIVGFLATVTAIAGWICWRHLRARRMEKGNMPQEMITYSLRNTHRPIPLQSFRQYYETRAANSNNGFFQDFEELKEVGKDQPKTEAELPANTSKNRYPHVLPYDYSRVKLSLVDEEPHSDYINANFVPGYNSPQEFIATQGPLKKTLDDFWRLVWEQHICTIVMLTVGMENGRVLCEYYWPSDSSPFCSGQIRIHLLAQNFADEWTTREFRIQHEGLNMERRVIHLHYTAWSNHGVPESTTSLNAFVELVRAHMQSASETGPTLVHGSAGVGRTGTFIALDRLLQQLKYEKVVDVFNTIYSLRMNRHRMIETLGQYIFLHSCILDKISEEPLLDQSGLELSHPIPLKNFVQHHAKNCSKANAGFLREYEQVLLEAAKEEVNSVLPFSGSQPIGLESGKISYDRSKVKFSPLDRDPFSDLSHVWFIPGCNSVKDYIAIEGPDKLALEEFWGLIWEYGVHTIITLLPGQMNCPAPDNSCWPSESDPVCTERLTIQQGPKKVVSGWPCIQLRLKYEKKAKERLLQRFQFPLAEGEELPDPEILVGFLTVIRQLVPYRKRTSPVVLHCSMGGLGQMGMLIALDTLLQQLKEEKSVDVYGVVLRLVRSCCLMTPTLDRYIYLYDCIRDTITQKQV